ncbi:MAG: hypothetical protein IPL71_22255 [Anaerolineales bacterium]|uniref:hypothetical protein n=1 Tax=Candidatus Villigracilis proximus TaxID=3140683 RepID=UPI00313552FA|nr:hypothetical protein [Anaerolineales bacterium]
MENLEKVLGQTILFLGSSEDSLWSSLPVEEIIKQLKDELDKVKNFRKVDEKRLGYLFAPTGCIQEISIENGWGNEFLELSNAMNQFV